MATNIRDIARRHVTYAVDLAPRNTYSPIEARKALYQQLIADHTIKDPNQRGNEGGEPRDMTVSRYADVVKNLVAAGGTNTSSFFRDGSGSFTTPGFLESFGYRPPAQEAGQGSETATGAGKGSGSASLKGTDSLARDDELVNTKVPPKIHLKSSKANVPAAEGKTVGESVPSQHAGSKRPRDESGVEAGQDHPLSKVPRTADSSSKSMPAAASTSSSKSSVPEKAGTSISVTGTKRKERDSEQDDPPQTKQTKVARTEPSNGQNETSSALPAPQTTQVETNSGAATSAPSAEKSSKEGQAAAAGKKRGHDQVESDDLAPVHPLLTNDIEAKQPRAKKQKIDLKAAPTSEEKNMRHAVENDPLGPHGHKLEPLGGSDIDNHLARVFREIEKAVMSMVGRDQLQENRKAEFVDIPQWELDELYVTLLGKHWRRHVVTISLARDMLEFDLLQSCMAAAVYQWVYERPAQWQTPRQLIEQMQDQRQLFSFNRWLREPHGLHTATGSIQTAVWHMGRVQTEDPEFHKFVIRPIAEDLADKLLLVLQPQIALILKQKLSHDGAAQKYDGTRRCLVNAFQSALILKAKMEASPGNWQASWIPNGAKFDRMTMKDERQFVEDRDEAKEVLWCVSPEILFRQYAGNDTGSVVEARVLCKPTRGEE